MFATPLGPYDEGEARVGWDARLDLHFERSGSRTRLVRRRHVGPLQVQRPFHPEAGGAAHVYVLHPPGGIVGGDRLSIQATATSGAEVLLTTPAATKFYRSSGARAEQCARVRVGEDSTVEWLPQETIVFGGARAANELHVDVARGGKFLGWEICCLGRPASGDAFEDGSYAQRLTLSLDGVEACVERASFATASPVVRERWGLGGSPVFGTLIALTDRLDLADLVRSVLPLPASPDLFGVTVRRNALVCRYLGSSVAKARAGFVRAWSLLREVLFARPTTLPRIWST